MDGGDSTQFVIISGYDDFEYMQKAIKLNVFNYIRKPVVQQELINTLKDITRHFHPHRKPHSIKRSLGYEDICLMSEFLKEYNEYNKPFSFIILLPGRKNGGNISKCIEEVKTVLRKHTSPGTRFRFIMDNHGENIYVFITGSNISSESVKFIASQMTHIGFSHIAAGGVVKNTTVSKCLHETIMLSNTRFFNRAGKLLVYDDELKSKQSLNIDLNELDILLEYGIWQDTESYVKELFDVFCNDMKNCLSLHILVRNTAIKLINCLVKYNLTIPDKLKQLMNIESLLYYYTKEELVSDILSQAEHAYRSIEKAKSSEEMITSVCNYIKENYYKDLSLKSVADKFFVNPTYLSKRFKEKKKISFSKFVETVRIEKAKELLEMTDINITDIAQKVGYEDPNYFTRVFKKVEKKPPSYFRKSK